MKLKVHPLARLEPNGSGRWLLSREDSLRGHRVSPAVAAVVVEAFAETTPDGLVKSISDETGSQNAVRGIIDWLTVEGYLVDPRGDVARTTSAWLNEWNANGWRAASRYHARTFGYPFEFYDPDGNSAEDVRRMMSYNQQQPDIERAKGSLADATSSYSIPVPTADLNNLRFGVGCGESQVALDCAALLDLLALVCRPIRAVSMPYLEAAKLLRKTSPSGGSRHPTEFYLVGHQVPNLIDGVYQVASVAGTLDSVDSVSTPPSEWLDLIGVPSHGEPWALVIYSSFLERNRYRYREPRTFRTVHMDVGHLMATCEFIGRANGWNVEQVQHIDGSSIASHLGIDNYIECPIAVTLLSANRKCPQ